MVVGVLINQNDGVVQITATGGETDLDFNFPLYAKSHLEIIRTRSGTDTTLVLNTDYTIADGELEQEAGGTAVLVTGATAADVYTLRLNVPESRTTDFTSAGDFLADDLNQELDLITQQLQQLRRDLDRSARLPDSTSLTSLTITPEASKLLQWNSSADGIENVAAADLSLSTVSSFIETLLDDTTAAAARTTLGAAQLTSALTTVTMASGDLIHIADASDSNNEKKALASDLATLLFANTRFNIGTITRDMTAATGSVAYTGVGFTPAAIIFIGGIAGLDSHTWGFSTGSGANRSTNIYPGGSGALIVQGTFAAVIYEDVGKYQSFAVTSMDADGFTGTWTKGSTPAANTGTLYYLAFR